MICNILVNFPSNVGDVILAFPALDMVKSEYFNAKIVAISSERTKDIASTHKFIDQVVVYDKRWGIIEKLRFCRKLKGKFDLIVDFKHSMLPFILKIPKMTPMIRFGLKATHLKDRNLRLISGLGEFKNLKKGGINLENLSLSSECEPPAPRSIFIATSSNSFSKSYPRDHLKIVVEELSKQHKIVLIGCDKDKVYYAGIDCNENVVNLAGKTSLSDVCYLFGKYGAVVLSVDSGMLHLASYMNLPIVALFGPTDPKEYGPWSDEYKVLIGKDTNRSSCKIAKKNNGANSMNISTQEVIDAVLGYMVNKDG